MKNLPLELKMDTIKVTDTRYIYNDRRQKNECID